MQLTSDEIRELRTDVRRVLESIARLEVNVSTILGNGQPGRLTILENKVNDLSAWRWRVVGIAGGVSTAVAVLFHYLKGN